MCQPKWNKAQDSVACTTRLHMPAQSKIPKRTCNVSRNRRMRASWKYSRRRIRPSISLTCVEAHREYKSPAQRATKVSTQCQSTLAYPANLSDGRHHAGSTRYYRCCMASFAWLHWNNVLLSSGTWGGGSPKSVATEVHRGEKNHSGSLGNPR